MNKIGETLAIIFICVCLGVCATLSIAYYGDARYEEGHECGWEDGWLDGYDDGWHGALLTFVDKK